MTSRIFEQILISSNSTFFILCLVALFKDVDAAAVSTDGSNTQVTAGVTDLHLNCSVSGLATNETVTSFTWKFSSRVILTYTLQGSPSPTAPWTASAFGGDYVTAKLPRGSLDKTYKGTYECSVVLSTEPLSKTVAVEVHYKPEVSIAGTSSVKEGDNLSLTCNSAAVPAVTSTSWKKGSTVSSNTKTLSIPAIKADAFGVYICSATNSVGTTPKTVNVNVYYFDAPVVSSATVPEKGNLTVRCSVRSKPTPTLTITGPGQNQSHTGDTFDYDVPTSCESTGEYTCKAVNSKYTSPKEKKFNVTVLCSPRKDPTYLVKNDFIKNMTESASMIGAIISYPPATFKWTKQVLDTDVTMEISNEPGHLDITNTMTRSTLKVTVTSPDDFAKYTLEAENSQGKTTLDYFLRAHTIPYQVTFLEEVNVTQDSLAVRWISSFNGGSEQSFILQYRPVSEGSDRGWIEKTREISDTGRNKFVYDRISGVYPGRQYAVRVFSRNALGQSQYSDEINVTTEDFISFGTGIAIGFVIALVLVAIVIGAIFLYLKKIKPAREARTGRQNVYEATNGQPSTPGLYDGLEGNRDRPTTYDDLKTETNIYQNVERKDPQPAHSQEKVYMNLTSQKSDASLVHDDKQVYANT